MRRVPGSIALVLLAAVLVVAGCQPKAAPSATPAPETPKEPAKPAAPAAETPKQVTEAFPPAPVEKKEVPASMSIEELNRSGVLKTVHFDYDSSTLSDEAREILQANAAWMKANPGRRVMVGGHCDERGTVQYNIALGDRRAKGVLDYLVGLGVDASRLRAVSFGKEKPLDEGHDEEAWKKNRRAEFTIES